MKLLILLFCLASIIKVECGEKKDSEPLVSEDCLDCLCQLQTECDIHKGCYKGACGPFQITMPFWEDTEGIQDPDGSKRKDPELKAKFEKCTTDLLCSTNAIQKYMKLYKRDCNGDGVIDCLDYAAIHNLGPTGCLKKPFPEKKRSFMESCLKEKVPGIYTVKTHELIEQEKVENDLKDLSDKTN